MTTASVERTFCGKKELDREETGKGGLWLRRIYHSMQPM